MRLHGSYSRTWIKGYNPLNHPNSYGSEFNPKKPSLSIGMELSKALIKYFRVFASNYVRLSGLKPRGFSKVQAETPYHPELSRGTGTGAKKQL